MGWGVEGDLAGAGQQVVTGERRGNEGHGRAGGEQTVQIITILRDGERERERD